MATEVQSQVNADWRARQKERERERRRMRDRQRRQSMSIEEREKHLARRRKNYQLRRQRAATSQELGLGQTVSAKVESDTFSDNHHAIECVSDVNFQQDGFSEACEDDNNAGETMHRDIPYKYPRLPRLNDIRKLARVLSVASEDTEMANPNTAVRSRIRLIHIKHLARALHSNKGF